MRRAVLMVCDGLSREWISPASTPNIWALKEQGLWAAHHRAVFPSVTRASAAAVATGHTPGHHGLHGNRMCFLVDGKLEVRDAGLPDFRDHMRRATKPLQVLGVVRRERQRIDQDVAGRAQDRHRVKVQVALLVEARPPEEIVAVQGLHGCSIASLSSDTEHGDASFG